MILLSFLNQSHVRLTAAYGLSFMLLGLNIASVGPILLDLLASTGASIDSSGLLFTARSVGYFLGSLLSGPLVDRFPTHGNRLIACAMLLAGVFTALIPFFKTLSLVCFCYCFVGLGKRSFILKILFILF
jgi:FHS family Na+ dependent glucose MFS transporter 1